MANNCSVVTGAGTILEIGFLEKCTSTPLTYSVELGTAYSAGSSTISVQSVPELTLYKGDTLFLGDVVFTINQEVAVIGAVAAAVAVVPVDQALAANISQGTSNGLHTFIGADSANFQVSNADVDVSSFEDSYSMQNVKVSLEWSVEVSGTFSANAAIERIIRPACTEEAFMDLQAYVRVTYSNGDVLEGVVNPMSYSENLVLRDAKKMSVTLKGQSYPKITKFVA